MAWLATLGPIGHLRPAPGTWGSAAALILAYLIAQYLGALVFLVLLAVANGAGTYAVYAYAQGRDHPDAPEVVIDELVGQWIALTPVIVGGAVLQVEIWRLWPGWLAAFLLFRAFDIWKPGLIGRMDAKGTPQSVMMDDILAGVAAAVGVIVLAVLAHLVV